MSNIIFVSDYFENEIRRGAEVCNTALLYYLSDLNPSIIESNKLNSIDSTKFYIITNFWNLSDSTKNLLIKYKNYLIYEHDHKYIPTRNPFKLPTGQENITGIVPKDYLINVDFYNNAKIVICQTFWHEQQLNKNLDCITTNIHGSFYLPEDLNLLEKFNIDAFNRKNKYAFFNDAEFINLSNGQIMQQGKNIKNKNESLNYCLNNKLPYIPIPRINDKQRFWETLSRYKHFIFFPDIPETCSRLLIETKMLGLNVITNKNSGAYWEPWFKLNGFDLISHFRDQIIPQAVTKFRNYIE
jgi:hypothetical protein